MLKSAGIVESRAIGSQLCLPSVLGTLANALARHGHIDEGLAAIHEGLALADTNGDRFSLPEIHRVRGNLLLARSAADRNIAEAAYRQAIEIALAQQARLLELRAATTLARLWGENGKRAAARELLTPVYEKFADGFDTADLKDAKSLLGDPAIHILLVGMGFAVIELGRFEEAIVAGKKALRQHPSYSAAYRCLAAAFAHLHRDVEARAAAARLLELDPAFTISGSIARGGQSNAKLYIEGLRKAGFPSKLSLRGVDYVTE